MIYLKNVIQMAMEYGQEHRIGDERYLGRRLQLRQVRFVCQTSLPPDWSNAQLVNPEQRLVWMLRTLKHLMINRVLRHSHNAYCRSPQRNLNLPAHFGSSGPFAGPFMTSPLHENLDPWIGQSQLFSSLFQATIPFKCLSHKPHPRQK